MTNKVPTTLINLQPEPQKTYANSTQEYYHPTKYQPTGASLAPVMRSMSPLRLRLRSGSGPAPAPAPGGSKSEVTQRIGLTLGPRDVRTTPLFPGGP